ncbi:diacylglycerol kinase family protein [Synechococcales cyanobacterium C]|uniref:Diacylglycerol kinase family protein n=1 Tax=Petrachloros mirabilis ULC683 TaxID=2781853 RepID=A0A8K2A874_9CYAN|nr:diacylglycerol kinase family protein [Petrachloros mirabilis]NCJ06924.1 diacylglycerol kinase family protein [Petrachloros mirabilis ULC683]
MAEKLLYPPTARVSNQGAKFHFQSPTSFATARSLPLSFKYAWAGVSHTFRTQRNFRIHVFVGTLAITLGLFLGLSGVEMAAVTLTSALVMILELMNTAIEAVVDLTVGCTYHRLAKTAKDCAAGMVLLSAIAALAVAAMVLLPPLSTWLQFSLLEF